MGTKAGFFLSGPAAAGYFVKKMIQWLQLTKILHRWRLAAVKHRFALLLELLLTLALCCACAEKPLTTLPLPQERPVQDALAEDHLSAPQSVPEPEPEPAYPELSRAEAEIRLFGRPFTPFLYEDTPYVPASVFFEAAGLPFEEENGFVTAQGHTFGPDTAVGADAGCVLQADGLYLPMRQAAELLGFVNGHSPEGTEYLAHPAKADAPAPNVNVPVLMYHAVSDDCWGFEELFVKPAEMELQLQYLVDNGYDAIFLEDLSHVEDYEKPVILTFDDGYDDNYTELFPLLEKYGVKATIFVIGNAMGKPHKMTQAQVYELASSGLVSIQSHGYTHREMGTLSKEELDDEMRLSRDAIACVTGFTPYALCYPVGSYSDCALEAARQYYSYGLLMSSGLYNTSMDPLLIPRGYISR